MSNREIMKRALQEILEKNLKVCTATLTLELGAFGPTVEVTENVKA
jgi:hypothetical protein